MSIKEIVKCHILGLHNDLEKEHAVHYKFTIIQRDCMELREALVGLFNCNAELPTLLLYNWI